MRIHPLSSQTYLVVDASIPSPMVANLLTTVRDVVKREYDYIVVGTCSRLNRLRRHMLCNRRRSKCARVLLDVPAQAHARRPQALSSRRACLRTPQPLCSSSKQDARTSTRTLSVRSHSLSTHLRSPFSMHTACPGRWGGPFSIPISSGAS